MKNLLIQIILVLALMASGFLAYKSWNSREALINEVDVKTVIIDSLTIQNNEYISTIIELRADSTSLSETLKECEENLSASASQIKSLQSRLRSKPASLAVSPKGDTNGRYEALQDTVSNLRSEIAFQDSLLNQFDIDLSLRDSTIKGMSIYIDNCMPVPNQIVTKDKWRNVSVMLNGQDPSDSEVLTTFYDEYQIDISRGKKRAINVSVTSLNPYVESRPVEVLTYKFKDLVKIK